MKHYLATKKNKLLIYTTCMNLKIRRKEEPRLKKKKEYMILQNSSKGRLIYTDYRLAVA